MLCGGTCLVAAHQPSDDWLYATAQSRCVKRNHALLSRGCSLYFDDSTCHENETSHITANTHSGWKVSVVLETEPVIFVHGAKGESHYHAILFDCIQTTPLLPLPYSGPLVGLRCVC